MFFFKKKKNPQTLLITFSYSNSKVCPKESAFQSFVITVSFSENLLTRKGRFGRDMSIFVLTKIMTPHFPPLPPVTQRFLLNFAVALANFSEKSFLTRLQIPLKLFVWNSFK